MYCSRAGAAGHQWTGATGAPELVNRPDKPTTSEGGTPAALGMLQETTTCLFRTEIGFPRQVGPWVSGDGLPNMSQGCVVWIAASTEISGQQLASPTEAGAAVAAGVTPSLHTWPELEMGH